MTSLFLTKEDRDLGPVRGLRAVDPLFLDLLILYHQNVKAEQLAGPDQAHHLDSFPQNSRPLP